MIIKNYKSFYTFNNVSSGDANIPVDSEDTSKDRALAIDDDPTNSSRSSSETLLNKAIFALKCEIDV